LVEADFFVSLQAATGFAAKSRNFREMANPTQKRSQEITTKGLLFCDPRTLFGDGGCDLSFLGKSLRPITFRVR